MPSSTVRPSPAMTCISSRTTFSYNRAFPVFWFGGIGLFAFVALTTGIARRAPVVATTMTNPPQITLRLVQAGVHGNEITLSPKAPFTLSRFAGNAIAEDLMVRVDQARANRRQ